MSAVTGVMYVAMAAVYEEMAVSPLSVGAMPTPNGAPPNRTRVFHAAAGEAPGSARLALSRAFVRPLSGGVGSGSEAPM